MLVESWFIFSSAFRCANLCACAFFYHIATDKLWFDFLILHKGRFWVQNLSHWVLGCHFIFLSLGGLIGRKWVKGKRRKGRDERGMKGRVLSYVESWFTTLPPFMVGVPELFLERPCFSPISCSDGSLYIHTGRQKSH